MRAPGKASRAQALVVLVTAPDTDQAAALARAVVEERLAACVNIVPQVRSIYRFEGRVCDDAEVLCVIKTTRSRYRQLEARLRAMHPYDVPEVIALPVTAGSRPFLDWIRTEVSVKTAARKSPGR